MTGRVAAHSRETAAVGIEILEQGGNAADAAAAMTLTACVAEPLVVSLLSGMHAVVATASGRVQAVDAFVDVPSRTTGGRTVQTSVVFDAEEVAYTIGGATFGVPGLVAGCGALNRDHGRLGWEQVVRPAHRIAGTGVKLGAADAVLLRMLAPVMCLDTGQKVFCRDDGTLKAAGDRIVLPDVAELLEELAVDGPQAMYTGGVAEELAAFCAAVGALVVGDDLARMTAVNHTPPAVVTGRHVVRTRRGLSPLTDWIDHLAARPVTEPAVVRVAAAQHPPPPRAEGTASLAAIDADGGACAVTASLGLGTGDWFRGQQLNSMLGEVDLRRGPLRPRMRMGSMMAPTVLLDDDGVLAVLGAAGGSRISSAMLRVVDAMTTLGLSAATAVELPRIHRVGEVVHVEPDLDDADDAHLRQAGWEVRRWQTRHHFFGGVSAVSRNDACGDPRRDGAALATGP